MTEEYIQTYEYKCIYIQLKKWKKTANNNNNKCRFYGASVGHSNDTRSEHIAGWNNKNLNKKKECFISLSTIVKVVDDLEAYSYMQQEQTEREKKTKLVISHTQTTFYLCDRRIWIYSYLYIYIFSYSQNIYTTNEIPFMTLSQD